jgi:hypothetical protein
MKDEKLEIDRIVQLATSWMDSIDGVTGVGQGQTDDGRDAVIVYAITAEAENKLPPTFKGVPVLVKTTEKFEAQ